MAAKSSRKRVRNPIVRAWEDEVIADNFAGGGGASSGIELALGRSPDVAVNHDPEAIAMHAANHPDTRHYIESVWEVDPRDATGGRPVALAWFSPDCKHFSKAKGGKPRDQKIRGLAWIAVTWASRVKPRVIVLENVEEFQDWGPLHRTGPKAGQPIASRRGETYRAFERRLGKLGYVVERRLLRACDFGAPTTRKRFFLIARRDGLPIRWPVPTHGRLPGLQPFRTAAECIDWSLPMPSIFERDRPLAANTLARVARGVRKFVLEAAKPFIIPTNHSGDQRVNDIDEPLRTVTAQRRGSHAIVVPYLVHRSNGERPGQAPRIYDPQAPLGTIVAQGQKHALCAAFLIKHYGGNGDGDSKVRDPAAAPFDTITTIDHHALAVVNMVKLRGTSPAHIESSASGADEPVPTISASGTHVAAVASFLVRFNGAGTKEHQLNTAESVETPLGTLTSRDRYGLVTVQLAGEEYVLVDIGMRMLSPRELFRAQGFPDDYDIAPVGPNGKPLTKTAQVRMCGNSVCPPLAAAIVRANLGGAS